MVFEVLDMLFLHFAEFTKSRLRRAQDDDLIGHPHEINGPARVERKASDQGDWPDGLSDAEAFRSHEDEKRECQDGNERDERFDEVGRQRTHGWLSL